MSEITVQKIEYWRSVRPPTLKQFVIRKIFEEQAGETKDMDGTSPDANRVLPNSAIHMRKLKDLKAKDIIQTRPDLVQEWEKKYGKK